MVGLSNSRLAVLALGLTLACAPTTDDESPTAPVYDCAALPEPIIRQLDGPRGAADIAFDKTGALIGGNTTDLFRATQPDAPATLWIPGVSSRAAVRMLSDGRVAVVQEMFRRVLLFEPWGASELLISDLDYPFGLVEGPGRAVYIADDSRIVRVSPEVKRLEVWLRTPDFLSRWLSFDRDAAGLFIAGRGPTIHRVEINDDGSAGELVAWGTLPVVAYDGSEPLVLVDGIGVDACGNVYVAEFHSRALYKFGPEGGEAELFVQWEHWEYGHGLQWGAGVGEWSATALYLPQPYNDHNVIEVEIGVPRTDG